MQAVGLAFSVSSSLQISACCDSDVAAFSLTVSLTGLDYYYKTRNIHNGDCDRLGIYGREIAAVSQTVIGCITGSLGMSAVACAPAVLAAL